MQFDGKKSHVTIPSLRYTDQNSITLEAWVKIGGDGRSWGNIISNLENGGVSISAGPDKKSGIPRLWFTVHDNQKYQRIPSDEPVPFGWVHVAGVFNGKRLPVLFVNGRRQRGVVAFEQPHRASSLPFMIGANPNSGFDIQQVFNGRIFEVRISRSVRYTEDFTPQKHFETDKSTLALYHFDEGRDSLLHDTSGHDFHGGIIGATWVDVGAETAAVMQNRERDEIAVEPGSYGLKFDGKNDYVKLPSLKYNGDTPITLEGWVRVDLAGKVWGNIISNLERGGISISAGTDRAGTPRLWFSVRDNAKYQRIPSDDPIPLGQFHFAGVFDGQESLVLYINGRRQQKVCKFKGPHQASLFPFMIGANPEPQDRAINVFNGVVSEFRISRSVRYTEEFTPKKQLQPDEHTIALYEFDEGRGRVLQDASGNGYHGSIRGATWVKTDELPSRKLTDPE